MGRYSYKGVAPFGVGVIGDTDASHFDPINYPDSHLSDCASTTVEGKKAIYDIVQAVFVSPNNEDCGFTNINGWTADGTSQKFGDTWAYTMKKGRSRVYYTNESEYEHVGYLTLTVVANSKKSLDQFCKDFSIPKRLIEKNMAIICTC